MTNSRLTLDSDPGITGIVMGKDTVTSWSTSDVVDLWCQDPPRIFLSLNQEAPEDLYAVVPSDDSDDTYEEEKCGILYLVLFVPAGTTVFHACSAKFFGKFVGEIPDWERTFPCWRSLIMAECHANNMAVAQSIHDELPPKIQRFWV